MRELLRRRDNTIENDFNGIIERVERSMYKGNGIKISDYAVSTACEVLQQKYETGEDCSVGLDNADQICSLVINLESWARRPFGRWHENRIGYINRAAEDRKKNSVK